MKKILHNILGFSLIFSFANVAHAQESNIVVFGGSNSDYFENVVADSDGGYTAFGNSVSANGDMEGLQKGTGDAVIVRYDANNDIVWKKVFGGNRNDGYMGGTKSPDGGFVAVGYSASTSDDMVGVARSSGTDNDAIIVKYDSAGNVVWKKAFGGTTSTVDAFHDVTAASGGGYVAVGRSQSANGDMAGLNKGDYDAIIAKYDEDGNKLWTNSFGGSGAEYFESVVATPDGGFVAVGHSVSTDQDMAGLSNGGRDGIMVKFDSDGNLQWKKSFGGVGDEYFYSVISDGSGDIVVAGRGSSVDGDMTGLNPDSLGRSQSILVKYDGDGNLVWKKSFGGSDSDYYDHVVATPDNGFIAIGYTESADRELAGKFKGGSADAIIVKHDANGDFMWVQTFGGSGWDRFLAVAPTSDGKFVAVGHTNSNDGDMQDISKGNYDAITVRFDHNGSWDYMPNDPSDPNPVDGDDGDDGQSNGLAPKLQCSGSVCNILPGMNKANKNHFILANKKESVDISTLIPRNYAVIIALWD